MLLSSHFKASKNENLYCEKHYTDASKCLLSSRVYNSLIEPKSFLILNFDPLRKDIQNYITNNNYNISIYVLNMRDSASFGINENTPFESASLSKLPIAMIIMKKIEEGELSLNTTISILDKNRDSKSGTLYSKPIDKLTIKELLTYMLTESDNTAYWTLSDYVTLKDLQKLTNYLNFYTSETNLMGVYEITPKTTGNLFLSLYLSTVLKPEDSEFILSLLTHTIFDIKSYAHLSNDTIISQKFGGVYAGNDLVFHNCGIMYVQDSRIFYCIMSRGLEMNNIANVFGTIVNKTYSYIINAKKLSTV